MSTYDDERHDIPVAQLAENASGPQTLMDQLRAAREDVANSRETFVPIPGYEQIGLYARHRLMERPEVEQIGRKIVKETRDRGDRQMLILLDQIIGSTTGFFVRKGKDDVQLLDDRDDDNMPIMNWGHLADYLDGKSSNAREAVMFVFGNNEFAVGQYGIQLNRWMTNTSLDVSGDLMGEGV